MPALSGQVITVLTDAGGSPAVVVTWFFDPVTLALRNNPTPWTDPAGTVWPTGSGALIGVNLLDHQIRMRVNDDQGALVRRVTLPVGDRAVKAAALATAPAPDGPYTTASDLNGLTFDVA